MRYRHGAALADLLAETGYNRAVGPEHIAEPGGHKARLSLMLSPLDGKAQTLDINLGKALAATHDVGRIDGLVSRYHNHLIHTVLNAEIRHIARSHKIHQYGLARILFHQGHMLVSCRMKYNVRLETPECIIKPGPQTHISYDRNEIQGGESILQLKPQVVHRSLGVVEQDELGDTECSKLTAKLGTYRPGSTGHHNRLSCKAGLDFRHGHHYLITPQEVLDFHFTDARATVLSNLAHFRKVQNLESEAVAILDKPLVFKAGVFLTGEQYSCNGQAQRKTVQVFLVFEIIDRLIGKLGVLERRIGRNDTYEVVVR